MSEHRVTMLGASWRRMEDPTRSRDPRVRAVVGALATLPSPAPREEFRAELRAQLIAIAPRIISESRESAGPLIDVTPAHQARGAHASAAAPRHTDSALARIRRIKFGRPLAVVASVITAFALLLGGAVAMSRNALPGDTLYGLKRASENFELALAPNDTAKAQDYLKFAGTRVSEVQGLLNRAGGHVDANTAQLITSTLASSDADVRSASSLLGHQAVATKSATPLNVITAWAPSQLSRLRAVASAMPDTKLRNLTDSSAALVTAAVTRAQQLAPSINAGCLSNSATDALGPLPVPGCANVPVGTSNLPSVHPTVGQSSSGPGGTSSGSPAGGGIIPGVGGSSSGSGTGGSSSNGIPLPTLPTTLPTVPTSLPVSVKTCSIGVTLGPIVIGVGSCPAQP